MTVTAVQNEGEWTWMGGSNTSGHAGVYGTLGTPAAGNIPGARSDAVSWIDSSGHLWLFGGNGFDSNGSEGFLNDLWEFNPSTNQWAWMGGSSTAFLYPYFVEPPGVYVSQGSTNVPGGRTDAVSWTDSSGHLWLFGGSSEVTSGSVVYPSDLWEFNPSTNQWAWIGGSNSVYYVYYYGVPGSRASAVSWTDSSGHLWLFGGQYVDGYVYEWLNDLWEFNPSSNQWVLMGGSNTVGSPGQPGVYGTLGWPAAGNVPGGRYRAVSWTDSSGHLWLFGGQGYDANYDAEELNDLWEFNLSTNEWVWMGGSSTLDSNDCQTATYFGKPGGYNTLGTPAAGNVPGGRHSSASWTDSSGHLWLFGGYGYDANCANGELNDLWEFNPTTNQWTWMGGRSTVSHAGVYGTLGVTAAGNVPGGRQNSVSWTDNSGHLWLFGGAGYDSTGTYGYLNDLWMYQP